MHPVAQSLTQSVSDDVQASQLTEIRDLLDQGVLITHILQITLSQLADGETAWEIIRQIKEMLWNKPLSHTIPFNGQRIPMTVTWTAQHASSPAATAVCYYTASPYGDLAIATHTGIALDAICSAIRAAGFSGSWAIAHLISRPLAFLNHQQQQQQPAPAGPA